MDLEKRGISIWHQGFICDKWNNRNWTPIWIKGRTCPGTRLRTCFSTIVFPCVMGCVLGRKQAQAARLSERRDLKKAMHSTLIHDSCLVVSCFLPTCWTLSHPETQLTAHEYHGKEFRTFSHKAFKKNVGLVKGSWKFRSNFIEDLVFSCWILCLANGFEEQSCIWSFWLGIF